MGSSKLKLNPDKTEFILFGSNSQRAKLASCFPIDILIQGLVFLLTSLLYANRALSVCMTLDKLDVTSLSQWLLQLQMLWLVADLIIAILSFAVCHA